MKTTVVKAVIEKGSDNNYSIYLADIDGVFGTGITEADAKEELLEAIDAIREEADESGWEGYEPLKDKFSIEYVYDLSGFFKKYDYINASALARKININEGLMRRYSSGSAYISADRKKEIETAIHDISKELASVMF